MRFSWPFSVLQSATISTSLPFLVRNQVPQTSTGRQTSPHHQHRWLAVFKPMPKSKSKIVSDEMFRSWKAGESVPYKVLAETFEFISGTSGRLDKENLFSRLFSSVITTTPSELDTVLYLSMNAVAPEYEGLEVGVGDSLLMKAICESTGRKKSDVQESYEREGDLGTVAHISRTTQKTLSFASESKPLTAKYVLQQFHTIASISGAKSQNRKVDVIKSSMVQSTGFEAKYIVRALQGKLRIGTAESTVFTALAHAVIDTPPSLVSDDNNNAPLSNKTGKHVSTKAGSESPDSVTVQPDSLLNLLLKVPEKEPHEATKLRTASQLSKSKQYQCAEAAVNRAYSECPNITVLCNALLAQPLYRLYHACRLTTGIPLLLMLSKPTKEVNEILQRLSGQAFTMEYKYDGERAQIHVCEDGTVKVFSRNLKDSTEKFHELADVMTRARVPEVTSCIVDGEVVAYDREKGTLRSFQALTTRKRKANVPNGTADGTVTNSLSGAKSDPAVQIIFKAFDLLELNGKPLLRESLRTRRTLLHKAFTPVEGYFEFANGADHVENGDTAPIESFLDEACGALCEGLTIKPLDTHTSTYEPGKRSLHWLKLKRDYMLGRGGVCDSVDLVVIGGYYGRGARTGLYGGYLMACYDTETDEYQSVCKVGTGFKDEDLARHFKQLKTHLIPSKRKPISYHVGEALNPDDWFEPHVVWELQAADLSKSPVHRAGYGRVGETGRGVGLRFPRYLRDRPDKKPENATSVEQILDMYYSQKGVESSSVAAREDEDGEE